MRSNERKLINNSGRDLNCWENFLHFALFQPLLLPCSSFLRKTIRVNYQVRLTKLEKLVKPIGIDMHRNSVLLKSHSKVPIRKNPTFGLIKPMQVCNCQLRIKELKHNAFIILCFYFLNNIWKFSWCFVYANTFWKWKDNKSLRGKYTVVVLLF